MESCPTATPGRNENGIYWPDLVVAEPDLENVGVYVFTYETGVFSGGYSIGDAVDALKEYLRLDEVVQRATHFCLSQHGRDCRAAVPGQERE